MTFAQAGGLRLSVSKLHTRVFKDRASFSLQLSVIASGGPLRGRDDEIGVVQQCRCQQDLLSHAFRVAGDQELAVAIKPECLQQTLASLACFAMREAAELRDHHKVLQTTQVRVEVGLFQKVR